MNPNQMKRSFDLFGGSCRHIRQATPKNLRGIAKSNPRLHRVYVRTSEAVHSRIGCDVIDQIVEQVNDLGGPRMFVYHFENY